MYIEIDLKRKKENVNRTRSHNNLIAKNHRHAEIKPYTLASCVACAVLLGNRDRRSGIVLVAYSRITREEDVLETQKGGSGLVYVYKT